MLTVKNANKETLDQVKDGEQFSYGGKVFTKVKGDETGLVTTDEYGTRVVMRYDENDTVYFL